MGLLLILSILSTLIPLLIGMFISFALKKKTHLLDLLLFLSAGTILSLLCFDIVIEVIELALDRYKYLGILYTFLIVIITLIALLFLHKLIDKLIHHHEHHTHEHLEHDHSHVECFIENKDESYFKAGLFLLIALLFHNLPEGMTLGIIFKNNTQEGISLAISFALHNIVMGLSMALPLLLSKMKKSNIFYLIILAFIPSLLGAILGYVAPITNTLFEFILLSISSGVLLFVIGEEMLPLNKLKNNKLKALIFFALGFIVFMILHFLI